MFKFLFNTVCGILFCSLGAQAQVFEFTENKGQWNPEVKYKGELSVGAFFLKSNGYRVIQHHKDDFREAIEQLTGHEHHENAPKPTPFSPGFAKVPSLPDEISNGQVSMPVRSHVYDLVFEGSNPNVQIVPERVLQGHANYFIGSDSAKWKSGVKSYGALRYNQIYKNIDVRYFSEDGFLKFDILVNPGGNIKDIVMHYEGAEKLSIQNGELVITTSVGEVREKVPYTYQLDKGVRKVIDCQYVISGKKVTFKTAAFNPNETLVIDPTLVFSTFSGSTTDNWGYTATFDGAGNAYGGGISFNNGYPTTVGAFQRAFGGGSNTGEGTGFDIALTKFNPGGTARIYSTYLGGGGNEQPHSLVVDNGGNLIVSGRTTSNNYPTTAGGRLGALGNWDIVVTKFNANGSALIGSVLMGGAQNDGVNIKHKLTPPTGPESLFQNYGDDARSEVLTDRNGNIYVASCTRSEVFPTTPGVIQTTLNGDQDAVVLKFSPNMTLLFSTLVGGNEDDAAYVLFIEDDNNILIAGGTSSTNFPGDKAGTVGPNAFGGIADGFIARLNATGTALLRSTYVGTNLSDQIYGIQKDRFGFVYIMGTSTGSFGVRNAAFSQNGGKQFIAKLEGDFSNYVYSTVFGANTPNPNISPTAFLVDRCENVYVSGWGGQLGSSNPYPNSLTFNMSVTPDALQSTTDGKDFYFFVLERDAVSQLYGSFFGQRDGVSSGTPDHVDGGTSRFDPTGVIYQGICANCSPGQFPTTPGVVAPSKPGGATCNLAVVKINFDLSGVVGGIKSSIDGVDGDSSGCVPAVVAFRDTIGIAQTYQWDFGDGSPTVITTTPNINHTYAQAGFFRARLIAIDDSRCFPRDTSFVNIRVRPDRVVVSAAATKLEPCESLSYRFDNLSTPNPLSPYSDTSFTWDFGDNSPLVKAGIGSVTHAYPSAGTYNVVVTLTDTAYCNAPESFNIQLRVSPEVRAAFLTDSIGCAPYTARFNNTSAGGQTFFWDFGNGQTSTAINPTVFYANPGVYTVKLIASDPSTCNLVDSTTFVIRASAKPTALFNFTPNPPEENILVNFINQTEGAAQYVWIFGDGDTLRTTRRDTTIRHQYPQSGTYNACLVAIDINGCSDTLCRPVAVIVNPLVDVVTAFTPNNDGVNDRARVIGFGVSRLTFRVFNRWGVKVFETNSQEFGWDGTFKGRPQPMDAYAYTLDASLINGEEIRKSGSITLIR